MWCRVKAFVIGICMKAASMVAVSAQIRLSSDLNCDFSQQCRWRNDTMQPESVGWAVTSDFAQVANSLLQFPMSDGKRENYFAYSVAPPGRHESSFVSDIVPCQLGGAKLKFWYFFTGKTGTLDVCTRYPPGSLDPGKLHCYVPLSNARAQQWSLGSIELPPVSQSMEILLRARFEAPNDAVAVDDIQYEAILCENIHRGTSEGAGGQIDQTGAGGEVYHKIGQVASPPPHPYTPSYLPPLQPPAISTSNSPFNILRQSLPSLLLAPITPNIVNQGVTTVLGEDRTSDDGGIGISPLLETGNDDGEVEQEDPPKSPFDVGEYAEKEGAIATTSNCGLDCDFDSNHFCNYDSSYDVSANANARPWILSSVPVSNPLTGIQHDSSAFAKRNLSTSSGGGTFAYAGNSGNVGHVFELRLREVSRGGPRIDSFPATHTLHFDYYLAGVRGRLRVCLNQTSDNTGESCPFVVDGADMIYDSREWKTGRVVIPRGTRLIRFVADQLPRHYVIGLDSIRLLDQYERPSMNCDSNPDETDKHGLNPLRELVPIGGSNDEALWERSPPNSWENLQ